MYVFFVSFRSLLIPSIDESSTGNYSCMVSDGDLASVRIAQIKVAGKFSMKY